MRKYRSLVFVLLMLFVVAMPTLAQSRDIVEQAERDAGSFSTFVAMVRAAGLEDTFKGDGPYTVLMPTNDAFANFLNSVGLTADDVTADPDLLKTILEFHVLDGEFSSSDIINAYLSLRSFITSQIKYQSDLRRLW